MSAGIRSGVNWIRLNDRSRICATVLISSVLARPGTPVIRQWPPVNSAINTSSMTVVLPDDDLADLAEDALAPGGDPFGDGREIGRRRGHVHQWVSE